MSALDWMLKAYPEVKEREDMRRIIGRYGLTGTQQVAIVVVIAGSSSSSSSKNTSRRPKLFLRVSDD